MKRELAGVVGERGESIFELAITNYQQFGGPLFRPCFFGDRWPAVDYYVELLGEADLRPALLVQVKATTKKLARNARALELRLTARDCRALYLTPGPTYLVGVHEPTRRVFIRSIHERAAGGLYRIPIQYELTPKNLKVLYNEVRAFWKKHPRKPRESAFS